ncbi:hypothetical protein C0991_003063 [Blastosporella zonata]|nr:hypothetical protein C0991_003063 [Blastosporella zonata]
MPFFGDETITNFFRPISSKDKHKESPHPRKRKRLQDTEANRSLTTSGKKTKVQQKLVFSDVGQSEANSSKKEPSRVPGKTSKRGESFATPPPVEALARVSSMETPITRHLNPLPTPITAKRPAPRARPFLTPRYTEQPTNTPGPSSLPSTKSSLNSTSRHAINLPTPVTASRHAFYISRAQESPPSPERSLSPVKESSPEPSQALSVYPLSSQHEESMVVQEGQWEDCYYRDESPSPIPSQKVVPSSQSQADGTFDAIPLFDEDHPEPSTSPQSSIFLVPPLPGKIIAGKSDNDEGSTSLHTPHLPGADAAGETSLIEMNDGHEYVLSSQSQLLLPLHVSPRKNRRKASHSSSTSLHDDEIRSDEIIPSSQSIEAELDISSKLSNDRFPPQSDSNSTRAKYVQICHRNRQPFDWYLCRALPLKALNWHTSSSFSSLTGEILVDETPADFYDLPPKDEGQGSATEEESGDEEGLDFPSGGQQERETLVQRSVFMSQESQASQSQEPMDYPSSLPDVVKEFRDMFGGDGSYPDDFPIGIGLESSILFAQEGANVLLVDNRLEAAEAGAALINQRYPNVKAIAIKADVSKEQEVKNAVDTAVKEFGRLDVMFNNAGIMHPEDDNALNTEERIWDLTMQINLKGVWWGCKYAILAMRQNPTDESKGLHTGGSIINTASFVALVGAATPQLAYTASKGAVLAMTRELAIVHAREGIRINSLCPGPLKTPLLMDFLNTEEKRERRLVHLPMGRFGEAVELAKAALFRESSRTLLTNRDSLTASSL